MDTKTRNQILSALRRCFSRSDLRREALEKALIQGKTGPRGGKRYRCSACNKSFGSRSVQVDHKDPVIPIGKSANKMTWNMIIRRIWCSKENLQVLCTTCHKDKSNEERNLRKLRP